MGYLRRRKNDSEFADGEWRILKFEYSLKSLSFKKIIRTDTPEEFAIRHQFSELHKKITNA